MMLKQLSILSSKSALLTKSGYPCSLTNLMAKPRLTLREARSLETLRTSSLRGYSISLNRPDRLGRRSMFYTQNQLRYFSQGHGSTDDPVVEHDAPGNLLMT